MVITDNTHSHFSNSFMCVSFTILSGHCLYYSNFSFFAYYWCSINYYIMKTQYKLWWSFNIKIWWNFKIHKTCCLSFSLWIHPTYFFVFYMISLKNIILISIFRMIFFIIKLSNLLFWKNTTPIIISIFLSVVRLYIFVKQIHDVQREIFISGV